MKTWKNDWEETHEFASKPGCNKLIKSSMIMAGAAVLGTECSGAASSFIGGSERPNIVMIISDDATPAYHSCYGGRTPTPAIDLIAEAGALFRKAYCVSSICNPSRHTILTGQFPGHDPQIIEKTPENAPYKIVQNTNITPEIPTIGRMFRSAGYNTAFLGKWHNNWQVRDAGVKFPTLAKDADLDSPETDAALKQQQKAYSEFLGEMSGFEHVSHVVMANHAWLPEKLRMHNVEWMTQGALDFIEDAAGGERPFLLYLADTVIHSPNTPEIIEYDSRYTPGGKLDKVPDCHPPRFSVLERVKKAGLPLEGPLSGMQMGMIMLDDQVKAIEQKLRELGIEENTIILFTADHGIQGKASCYHGGVHVPMLMKWPGKIRPGTVVTEPVSFVDIAPTLISASGSGIGMSEDYRTDGIDFLPAVLEGEKLPRETLYMEMGYTRSVLKGKYHYIAFRLPSDLIAEMKNGKHELALDHWGRPAHGFGALNSRFKPCFFDPDQLFDVEKDPFERTNLAGDPEYAEILADMKSELSKQLQKFDRPFPLEVPEYMLSDHYRKLVKARQKAVAARPYYPQGYDAGKIFHLNLKDPLVEK